MSIAQPIVGIDVSKAHLDVFELDSGQGRRLANTSEAVAAWTKTLAPQTLVVLEATGIYDQALRTALAAAGIRAARVNPARARDFARALGVLAKTDAIDARMLAQMGRVLPLETERDADADRQRLQGLNRRRDQLVSWRARERTHRESADPFGQDSIARMLVQLDNEIALVEAQMAELIAASPAIAAQDALLRSAPGVGPVAARTLLASMPELGSRSDKAIAALAGLAPFNHDSGALRGTRHIAGGRRRVRMALYMAALNAARSSSRFKAIYQKLRLAGKPPKLALIAVARRLLVTLNAMIRDQKPFAA